MFSNFINRLRANFKELIVKPLRLQMCVEFPELKEDEIFLNQVDINFYSNTLFEEWKRNANIEKRVGILTTLLGVQTAEGQPYFHIDFLIDKYLKLTTEEKEENKAYWIKFKGGEGSSEGGAESGGEMGGGEMGGELGAQTEIPAAQGGAQAGAQAQVPPTGGEAQAGGGEFSF